MGTRRRLYPAPKAAQACRTAGWLLPHRRKRLLTVYREHARCSAVDSAPVIKSPYLERNVLSSPYQFHSRRLLRAPRYIFSFLDVVLCVKAPRGDGASRGSHNSSNVRLIASFMESAGAYTDLCAPDSYRVLQYCVSPGQRHWASFIRFRKPRALPLQCWCQHAGATVSAAHSLWEYIIAYVGFFFFWKRACWQLFF